VRDRADEAAAVVLENASVARGDRLPVDLRPGGGFVGMFER
jgi:hypothetical protein